MRKLLHLLFGWDYVSFSDIGIFRVRVNDDGVSYVVIRGRSLTLSVWNYKYLDGHFVHGTELDYFTLDELEEIHGTAHR